MGICRATDCKGTPTCCRSEEHKPREHTWLVVIEGGYTSGCVIYSDELNLLAWLLPGPRTMSDPSARGSVLFRIHASLERAYLPSRSATVPAFSLLWRLLSAPCVSYRLIANNLFTPELVYMLEASNSQGSFEKPVSSHPHL